MTVIELLKNLKKQASIKLGDKLWDYGDFNNCIDYWASVCPEFQPIVAPLAKTEYKNMILLRYDEEAAFDVGYQTQDDFWNAYEGLYRECRSVVLDKYDECYVLRPFRKFFNMNQLEETSEANVRRMIDNAKNVEFSNKLDGSMQSARWYNGEAVLAGSQGLNPELSYRLKYGYEMLTDKYVDMLRCNPNQTFIFEFIHPLDVHVVRYSSSQAGLYLIGIREVESGREWSYAEIAEMADKYEIPTTDVYNTNIDQVISELDDKKASEAEGFVINIDGYKIKLKYNDYVQIHKILNKIVSPNAIIHAIDDGTWDDLRAKLPESYKKDADAVAKIVFSYIKMMKEKVNEAYADCIKSFPDKNRKDIFLYAKEKYGDIVYYVMCILSNKPYSFIRNNSGRYMKLKDFPQ